MNLKLNAEKKYNYDIIMILFFYYDIIIRVQTIYDTIFSE